MPAPARRGGSPLSAGREEAEEGAGRAGAERERAWGRTSRVPEIREQARRGAESGGRAGREGKPGGRCAAAARCTARSRDRRPARPRSLPGGSGAGSGRGARARAPSPAGARRDARRAGRPRRRREDLAACAAAQQPGSTSDPARGAGSMATGLGEAVYGLSEDEVSCAPFPTGLPGRFLSGGGREWGVGRLLGCASPAPAGGPQRRERPGAGSRWGARFFRPEPAAPPPPALRIVCK